MNHKPCASQKAKTDAQALNCVLLCAGRGTRLKEITDHIPKCLVDVCGQAILGRMLTLLADGPVTRVIIVVGYRQERIRNYVDRYFSDMPVMFVENPDYMQTGSMASLALGLDHVSNDDNLLIIEGDVVLVPSLIDDILHPPENGYDGRTLVAPYEQHLSGTFVLSKNGRVSSWIHESRQFELFPFEQAHKTVNVTHLGGGVPLAGLKRTISRLIDDQGRMAPLEYAMERIVDDGTAIEAVSTAGRPWFEIDDQNDLAMASALFQTL